MTTQAVRLTVNGARREALVEARRTLADFLREDLALTGTHIGCEHGVCGACTVIVDGRAVRSCLMLAVQAEGSEVLTVEGLASGSRLHPVQEAFWENHGFQCGFCTPGFIMTTVALLADEHIDLGELDEEAIRIALSGNICRCTGYQTIVAGVEAAIAKVASAEADASESAGVLPGA